jgi:hypothetical protein
VRDADPEDKVDEIEAPKDWTPNSGHTDPAMQLVTPTEETPKDYRGEKQENKNVSSARA